MTDYHLDPFPLIITERLVLRKFEFKDVDEIFFLRTDNVVNLYLDRKTADSREEASLFISNIHKGIANNECLYWAITLKGSDTFTGTICLWSFNAEDNSAELGYELNPLFQGKGIMHESVVEVTRYGFEIMKLGSITAYSRNDNKKSIKLLEDCGFLPIKESEGTKNTESLNMRGYIRIRS